MMDSQHNVNDQREPLEETAGSGADPNDDAALEDQIDSLLDEIDADLKTISEVMDDEPDDGAPVDEQAINAQCQTMLSSGGSSTTDAVLKDSVTTDVSSEESASELSAESEAPSALGDESDVPDGPTDGVESAADGRRDIDLDEIDAMLAEAADVTIDELHDGDDAELHTGTDSQSVVCESAPEDVSSDGSAESAVDPAPTSREVEEIDLGAVMESVEEEFARSHAASSAEDGEPIVEESSESVGFESDDPVDTTASIDPVLPAAETGVVEPEVDVVDHAPDTPPPSEVVDSESVDASSVPESGDESGTADESVEESVSESQDQGEAFSFDAVDQGESESPVDPSDMTDSETAAEPDVEDGAETESSSGSIESEKAGDDQASDEPKSDDDDGECADSADDVCTSESTGIMKHLSLAAARVQPVVAFAGEMSKKIPCRDLPIRWTLQGLAIVNRPWVDLSDDTREVLHYMTIATAGLGVLACLFAVVRFV